MAIVSCRECKKEVSTRARNCPHCGISAPGRHRPQTFAVLVVFFLIIGAALAVNSPTPKSVDSPKSVAALPSAPNPHADCIANWAQCSDNAEVVDHYKDWSLAQAKCQTAATKLAKYGRPEWPWLSFGTYLKGKDYTVSGKATLIEPEARFKNAFGTATRTRVECRYDLRANQVIDVAVTSY